MSIIKNGNFDLVVEKAVELGVEEIIPVITERTVKGNLNIIRINKIIKEATEQSGRLSLMKIGNTLDLNDSIKKAGVDSNAVYFGSVDENDSVKQDNKQFSGKISVFIGPEGGYSDDEINSFVENKITPLRLGDYVLRAETAAIVACGLVSL
jgi:16S rRNA (uracil1498-N3)-methyltransferase